MKQLLLSTLIGLMVLPISAQRTLSKKEWKAAACVTYRYVCGSLPREEIRDYSINVFADHVSIEMWNAYDEYNVIGYEITPKQFKEFINRLAAQGLTFHSQAYGERVRGASTKYITVYKDLSRETEIATGFISKNYGTLSIKKGDANEAFMALLHEPIEKILDENLPDHRPTAVADQRRHITAEEWEATNLVRYSYEDATIVPEYHRSYSISICEDSIQVVITSYSEVLLRKTYPFTPEQFKGLKECLAEQDFSIGKPNGPEPMGGSSESVAFYKKGEDKSYFAGYVTKDVGTLYIEKGSAGEAFHQALPVSLQTLIESTRTNPQP